MYKIFIVEDDNTIATLLGEHLRRWNYEVYQINDFSKVVEEFIKESPHLVLMDIGLPFFNGFHWCSEIRKHSNVPIIFLSSANDNMSIVMAMNMGGDEFIEKPFDLDVATAKIQAVLRRAYAFHGTTDMLEWHGVILNISDGSVTNQGESVSLSKNEFRILQLLVEEAGSTVSRESIMMKLWESDEFIDDNTLTVNVTRLRKKLESIGIQDMIKTRKGVGYLVEA